MDKIYRIKSISITPNGLPIFRVFNDTYALASIYNNSIIYTLSTTGEELEPVHEYDTGKFLGFFIK